MCLDTLDSAGEKSLKLHDDCLPLYNRGSNPSSAPCRLRWDTGDGKISSFVWGGVYAHASNNFQKYIIQKIRVEFF